MGYKYFINIVDYNKYLQKELIDLSRLFQEIMRKQDLAYSESEYQESENRSKPIKKDKSCKNVQKQKTLFKKEKPAKKQKVLKKVPQKEEKKPQKSASNGINAHQMEQEENESQNLFQMSSFNDQSPINRNQQRSESQNESEEPRNQSQEASNSNLNPYTQEVYENLLMILMKFFISIEQQYGLAFKKQERKKLRKRNPNVRFTDQHQLQPQGKQLEKIRLQIPSNMLIFNKRNHNVQMTNKIFEQYIKKDIEKMISVFKQASYIFCQEVTHELYDILKKLCNIVVKDKNENDQTLIRHLRQFGDRIASQKNQRDKYLFFGYKFFTLSENLTEEQIKAQQKNNNKNRYLLKRKYRLPGTQFAMFTQNAGLHLRKIIESLDCYQTLS